MTRVWSMGLVVLLTTAAVVGCSSGPSAQQWAGQVCHALGPWRTEIAKLNDQAATQMASATTSAQARDNLVQLVSGAEQASEKARAVVAAAGVPDIDGGAAVAHSFEASLAGTRDAYARAHADLEALPADDEASFYDGVLNIMARLNEQYRASAVDTTTLSSPELKAAFDGIPECR